jgi:hypothetical protein
MRALLGTRDRTWPRAPGDSDADLAFITGRRRADAARLVTQTPGHPDGSLDLELTLPLSQTGCAIHRHRRRGAVRAAGSDAWRIR